MGEHTYFCPGHGTWVAIDDVSQEDFDEYPEGTREIGPSPGPGHAFDGVNWVPTTPSTDELRVPKLKAINERAAAILSAGFPDPGGLHVALDNDSRSDLTAMGVTASLAISGALSWPDSYARGWIAIENVRIPLATPAAGLSLAASVGDYYAAIVQHRRDLKDAVLAAENAEAIDAIDVSAGWPG